MNRPPFNLKLHNISWLVFAAVLGWKIALFIFTCQPVPANDAFFYDGAVIHQRLHGGYFNPSLAQALPISGTQLYSTYPPLYQAALAGWLSVFGVSALTVMGLHLALFAIYCLVLFKILRRLQLPPWCINVAGAFLFSITFHDRPDSLAHCLGVMAVYAWVRYWETRRAGKNGFGAGWLMSLLCVLTLCTSLQIGGIYSAIICGVNIFAFQQNKISPPIAPLLAMFLLPIGLVMLVKTAMPLAWSGFLEHARQTPSFTGLRMPQFPELAKIIRTVPGILLVAFFVAISFSKTAYGRLSNSVHPAKELLASSLLAALGVVLLSLLILTANTIAIANYLQPIIVAIYLASLNCQTMKKAWARFQSAGFALAVLLVSVRAIGMSTWGVACAEDVGYYRTTALVESAITNQPAGSKVVLSSAFLYDVAKHKEVQMIHSDWLARAGGDSKVTDVNALIFLKPTRLILTQFDYYRRFDKVLDKLQSTPGLVEVAVTNTAHIRAPDSYKSMQLVVQNISWAPVIVTLSWRPGDMK